MWESGRRSRHGTRTRRPTQHRMLRSVRLRRSSRPSRGGSAGWRNPRALPFPQRRSPRSAGWRAGSRGGPRGQSSLFTPFLALRTTPAMLTISQPLNYQCRSNMTMNRSALAQRKCSKLSRSVPFAESPHEPEHRPAPRPQACPAQLIPRRQGKRVCADRSFGVLAGGTIVATGVSVASPELGKLAEDICRLPAGHTAAFERGRVTVSAFWTPPLDEGPPMSLDEAAEDLDGLLRRAVSAQMMSDVPLGTFCSGGVDSGLVSTFAAASFAAHAADFRRRVRRSDMGRARARGRHGAAHQVGSPRRDRRAGGVSRTCCLASSGTMTSR